VQRAIPPKRISNLYVQEAFYEKQLILADREMVETRSDEILRNAGTEDVSLLVVGDPFGSDTRFSDDPFELT
jgi:diphthamide biosynthesis methyltransferase